VRGTVDDLPRRVHLPAGRLREDGTRAPDGHCPHVLDRQVVARQGAVRDHCRESSSGCQEGFEAMADRVSALPGESRDAPLGPRTPALRLLRRHDFRDLLRRQRRLFFVSGLLIGRVRRRGTGRQPTAEAGIRAGFAALRPRPVLAIGVLVLGVAVTISAGRWIAGVPTLVRDHLHGGAGAFSVVMVGYAADSIVSGTLLAHRPLRRKALASLVAWTL
jgi:hypothetical protein